MANSNSKEECGMANKFMLGKDVDRENILVAELKVDEAGDLRLYITGGRRCTCNAKT